MDTNILLINLKKNILGLSYTFLVIGLFSGVFYREFTEFYKYQADNHLSKLHVHVLILGFLLMMILYIVVREYDAKKILSFKKPLYVFISGFTFTIVNMTLFGIYEVVSANRPIIKKAALEGLSVLGHIILSIGIVWLVVKIFQNQTTITLPHSEK